MSFQQGLSGLNTSSKALDVIGNNISNSSTVGFKSAETHFSDVYANSLSGAGASQVGIGSSISGIQQAFSQGNITATNNPLDISINGGGFFRMENAAGSPTYTRNGQFHLDNEGFIVNDQGLKLTGFPGEAQNGTPSPIQLSSAPIAPLATSDPLAGDIQATLNLDSREEIPTVGTFSKDDPESYNYSTALSVYDTLGVPHNLTFYFVRTEPTTDGTWNVHATLDGAYPDGIDPDDPQPIDPPLKFDTSGKPVPTPPATKISLTLPSWTLTSGAVTPWPATDFDIAVDFSASTQYGSSSSVGSLTQGGYGPGSLTGLTVNADGIVQGRYSNGQTNSLGRVVLATFANPNGLSSLGNNQWQANSISGDELLGIPGAGTKGVLQSASIEESNVDLTAQLVNMITQQRNYQASAQTIKTQDQIMQTLVNLR